MNQEQIINQIEAILTQSIDGQDIENVKVECKSKWWDIKSAAGLNEFLKDTCAIVNTFGLDGFIIIGYDDKSKNFSDATFQDCGLRDNADIRNILIKHVSDVFDLNTFDVTIEGHKLSVIQIPPSVAKPHVLKVYKTVDKLGNTKEEFNKIFIRKNSAVHVASKNDIDIMYYDRKNVTPEYKLIVSIARQSIGIVGTALQGVYSNMNLHPTLTFENQGSRPIAVVDIELKFSEDAEPRDSEVFTFRFSNTAPIVVPVAQIVTGSYNMEATHNSPRSVTRVTQLNLNRRNVYIQDITITTNTGRTLVLPVLAY